MGYRARTFVLPFFFLASCSLLMAQQEGSGLLYLKSGKREIADIAAKSQEQFHEWARSEAAGDHFYVYLHFRHLPDSRQREQMEASGLQFLAFIPERTYLVSIPLHFSFENLPGTLISGFSGIRTEEKSATPLSLSTRGVPLRWLLLPYPDISLTETEKKLERMGVEVLGIEAELGALEIRGTAEELFKLRRFSWVRYVEESPSVFFEGWETQVLHDARLSYFSGAYSLPLEGKQVSLALGDDGFVGPHIDFSGRLDHALNINKDQQGPHGDLVAGIMTGRGNLNPLISGLAPSAHLFVLNDFEAVKQAQALYEEKGVVATCTAISDGCNRGYSTLANLADRQIRENPFLMHIFSAGNAGLEDCDFGAGQGWGNITGGVKMAKNILTVGFVDERGQHLANSSRGPASDGRIKPELCAYGAGIPSTAPNHSYAELSGSSAAAPVVAGIWAQLVEGYRLLHNDAEAPGALLKALLLNTAKDLGQPGPDFTYGWGLPRAGKAWQSLQAGHYRSDSLENKSIQSFSVEVPDSLQEVRFFLYWHDHEASPSSQKALVNDLDLRVISPAGDTLLPWKLAVSTDSSILKLPATKGRDSLNNAEQVSLTNPDPGIYTLLIRGESIPFGPQPYHLCWSFLQADFRLGFPSGGEQFIPGEEIEISWEAQGAIPELLDLEYSPDNGQSWHPIASVSQGQQRYSWQLPAVSTGTALIRITDADGRSQTSSSFSIFPSPEDLQVDKVCGNSLQLSWKALEKATGYIVYQLEGEKMDSLLFTGEVGVTLPISDPDQSYWFSVSAVFEGSFQSRRSRAVSNEPGLLDCELAHDMAVQEILSPGTSLRPDCFSQELPVAILIHNQGTETQSGPDFCYAIDGGTPICESPSISLPPGAGFLLEFDSSLQLTSGAHQLSVWYAGPGDEASYNDTIRSEITILPGVSYSLPYFETFDHFPPGNPFGECQSTYAAINGWINDGNGAGDDIDWRAHSGPTPTLGTGPSYDQNTRSAEGQYLYLESSQACFGQQASLMSPCIDLSGSSSPRMSFWYHMKGEDMGRLHIDLFDGEQWIPNLITPLSGIDEDKWQRVEVDLSASAGSQVMLRFRAVTGAGYLSDLAIDNISFYDAVSAPVPGITLPVNVACPGQAIQLYDNSVNNPESWNWQITPPNFQFLENSGPTSSNPVITFFEPGSYTINLSVSNSFGTAQVIEEEQIEVSLGQRPSYRMDFESDAPFDEQWKLYNEDNDIGWSPIVVKGRDEKISRAYYVNNHSYTRPGEEDVLQSPLIDLRDLEEPVLRFDLSYTSYSEVFEDQFMVRVSSDCGYTYPHVLYLKQGPELATAANQPNSWHPAERTDWRSEEIDLSAFAGESIGLQFVNICGFGNNLFLDNIWVGERGEFPHARISYLPADSLFCAGDTLYFCYEDPFVPADGISWRFEGGAQPGQIGGAGPHPIAFPAAGRYSILLEAENENGYDYARKTVELAPLPEVDFTYRHKREEVGFINQSRAASGYRWEFGDGAVSHDLHPVHSYSEDGIYAVQLTAYSACGVQQVRRVIQISSPSSIPSPLLEWHLSPNPAGEQFSVSGSSSQTTPLTFALFDSFGRQVFQMDQIIVKKGKFSIPVEAGRIPGGLYIGRLSTQNGASAQKILLNK